MNGSTVTADFYLLPPVQSRVLQLVARYSAALNEGCPSTYLARQLDRKPNTIRYHLAALHRKGWLRSDGAPATLARPLRPE